MTLDDQLLELERRRERPAITEVRKQVIVSFRIDGPSLDSMFFSSLRFEFSILLFE